MSYRRTRKYSAERMRAVVDGKARARLERPPQERAPELPYLRMRITVERFDCGVERHVVELHRTRRIDVYSVTIDGHPWRNAGLSAVLEGLRKACPRALSPRAE